MELRSARLCLDCEEVHNLQQCPVCGSETFTYLTRWIPAAEGRRRPRENTSEDAEVYRQLITPEAAPSNGRRLLKSGVLGLTALGLVGWLLRQRKTPISEPGSARAGERPLRAEE